MIAVETLVEAEAPTGGATAFAERGRSHALTLLTRRAQSCEASRPLLDALLAGRLGDLIDPALDVAVETGEPLGAALAQCFAREGTDDLAEWLSLRLAESPFSTAWPLYPIALQATQRFLAVCKERWALPSRQQLDILTALSHNQGRRLVTLGRASEALPFLQDALIQYESSGPEKRQARLQCLGTYSEASTQLGRLSEALDLAAEAVAASKEAASGADLLELAGHLVNLCGCLSDVDRHGDAIGVIEEAVALCHRHGWEGRAPVYARALLCRGNELHHLGRFQEAAESLEEAIALARDLEVHRTTLFEPDLALALADLSLLYEQLGRRAEAKQALDEAIDRYRRLEDRYPESFRPSLAWSLSLSSPDVQAETASVAARTEAVEHYRRLAAGQPAVYEPLLGHSLFDLSESLLAAQLRRAALQAANEAVARLRRVASNRRDLAWSLLLRGRIRSALGHRRKALADCQETVALFRQRSPRQAAFYGTDLAVALHELGIQYHYCGQFGPAIAVTCEAEKLYRRLAAATPQVLREDLACCLNSLSHHLYESGRVKESVAATRRSVKILRQLLGSHPDAVSDLAASLSNLAPRLSELGQPEKALQHAQEALALYRSEGTEGEGLATALHAVGVTLLDLERPAEAQPYLEEATSRRRRLAADQPIVYDVDLACSLTSLGKCLSDQGSYREALANSRQGARLLRGAIRRGGDFLRPRLGATLSNQAHQLRELGQPRAALAAAEEAVQLLIPYVSANPDPYRHWTTAAVGHYLAAAGEAGVEPDLEKVAELVVALAKGKRVTKRRRVDRSQRVPLMAAQVRPHVRKPKKGSENERTGQGTKSGLGMKISQTSGILPCLRDVSPRRVRA